MRPAALLACSVAQGSLSRRRAVRIDDKLMMSPEFDPGFTPTACIGTKPDPKRLGNCHEENKVRARREGALY